MAALTDLRVIDVTAPEFHRQFVVFADLLGQLAQLCQSDSEAPQIAGVLESLPVLDASVVLVGFQESHDFGLVHTHDPGDMVWDMFFRR